MTAAKEYTVTPETFQTIGRYTRASGLTFRYNACGVAFRFTGSSLEVKLSSSAYNETSYTYAAVYIDGRQYPIAVTEDGWYTVADGLEADSLHTASIIKRSESNCGTLSVEKIRLAPGGELREAEPYPTDRRIQVLGDSITCGFGNLYTEGDVVCYTDFEDGSRTYATMTAARFGAELNTVCISGIGLGTPDNEPWPILPSYNSADDADFDTFIPDVIVIALGTNDDAQGATRAEVAAAGTELVNFIRSHYPDAEIIWQYGIMSRSSMAGIQDVIAACHAAGDNKIRFLDAVADTEKEGLGLYAHPSMKTHERLADELTACIREVTGWDTIQ